MVSEPKAASEPEADMVSEPKAEAGASENQFLDLPKEKYIAARVAESQRVVQALQQLSVTKQKLETVVPDTKKKIHDRLEDKQEEIQDLSKELQGKKDAYNKLKTHQDEFILAAKKKAQKELQRANKSLQTADKIVRKKWARLVSYAVEFKCGNESARIVEDVMVAEEAHKCLPWCAERMPTMVTCLYLALDPRICCCRASSVDSICISSIPGWWRLPVSLWTLEFHDWRPMRREWHHSGYSL